MHLGRRITGSKPLNLPAFNLLNASIRCSRSDALAAKKTHWRVLNVGKHVIRELQNI